MDEQHQDYLPRIYAGLAVFFSWVTAYLFRRRGDLSRSTGRRISNRAILLDIQSRISVIEHRLTSVETSLPPK